MEAVNMETLQNSIRFVFEDQLPENCRTWILKLLKKVTEPSKVQAVFKTDNGKWHVTFDGQDSLLKVTSADFSGILPKFHVERCDRRTVNLKVIWLPVWIDLKSVETHVQQYGVVKKCEREIEECEGFKFANGTIKITLEMPENKFDALPYKDNIGGKTCLFVVAGRTPLCLKCKEVGHIRRNCTKGKDQEKEPGKESEKEPELKRKKVLPLHRLAKDEHFVLDLENDKSGTPKPVVKVFGPNDVEVQKFTAKDFYPFINREPSMKVHCDTLDKAFPGVKPSKRYAEFFKRTP